MLRDGGGALRLGATQRGTALDEQHTLVTTHRPDLFRLSETIALLIMVAVAAGIWRRKLQVNDPRFLCCGALLLLPFVVFNQQILTGRTMQVFHFDVFIINYVILIALVLALSLYKRQIPRRLLIWAGTLSIAWGVFATVLPAKLVFVPSAAARDRLVPVLNRLNELSKVDGSRSNLQTQATTSTLVYSPELAVTVLLPTWTSQGTLLDIGGIECATISREQRKEFFFMHLYYSNVTPERLRIVLNGKYDDPTMEHYAPIVIFGSERTSPVAGVDFTPIQTEEINREVRLYEDYFNSFSRTDMVKRPIAYAVVPAETKFDFSKLDLWYKRDTGERVGDYSLYRLEMRP